MKRIWIWLALLAAVAAFGMFPAQGTDAADLLPAQLLLVEASGGTLRLETDQGSVGFGKTLGEAMDDLQAGAKGQVFFGTVEHVVAAQSAARAALWPAAGGSAAADDGRRASPCRIDQPRASAMHGCWLQ